MDKNDKKIITLQNGVQILLTAEQYELYMADRQEDMTEEELAHRERLVKEIIRLHCLRKNKPETQEVGEE